MRRIIFSASDEEIAAWKDSAWASKLTLSGWIRRNLNDGTVFESQNGQIKPKELLSEHLTHDDGDS